MFFFVSGIACPKKLHYTYSFVIQRITWKNVLGIIYLENFLSVIQLNEMMLSELVSQSFLAGV